MKVNILDIIKGTTVDGPGFRTSIYFAGCRHECPECHNPDSWNFGNGRPTSVEDLMEIIEEEDFDVTLSGGDPLYNPDFVYELAKRIVKTGHTLWIYTGFTWEQIINAPRMLQAVNMAEVIVDSPYIKDLRDPDLLFRGSSNQRLIDVKASLSEGKICLWNRAHTTPR